MHKGFTLIEIMVVVVLFAVLAVIATQSTFLAVTQSKKSQSQIGVREDLDYALDLMERNIRNSDEITCVSTKVLQYAANPAAQFKCVTSITPGRLQWDDGSGTFLDITPDTLTITDCSFVCVAPTQGVPESVDINITARSKGATTNESASVSVSTSVQLRTY